MVGLSLVGNESTERYLKDWSGIVNGSMAKRQEQEELYEVEAEADE